MNSTGSRLLRFEAFAALQAVGLNELLISRQGLLRFRQAADAAVGLTQMKIRGVTIWRKFFCSFETLDGAGSIALLQKRAAKFEARHFIIRLGLNHFSQEGHSLLRVTLQKKRIAEVIAGDGIGRANLELGAEFRRRRFEIALAKVNQTHEIVNFWEAGIDLQRGPEFA